MFSQLRPSLESLLPLGQWQTADPLTSWQPWEQDDESQTEPLEMKEAVSFRLHILTWILLLDLQFF